MKLTVPDNLGEMNLRQLIALARFFEEMQKEEIEDKAFLPILSEFFDIGDDQVGTLAKSTLDEIVVALSRTFKTVAEEYKEILERKEFIHSFKCKAKEPIDVRTLISRWTNKDVTFYVSEYPENEPTALWLQLLDGVKKRLTKAEKITDEFKYISKVVACLAWRKDESRFIKGLDGNMQVDMNRVNKFEKVFLQMNAKDAINVFAFFLTMSVHSSIVTNMALSSKKQNTLIS